MALSTPAFSGTVEQCLQYLRTLPVENFRNLVDFTGASPGTVNNWVAGVKKNGRWQETPPAGEWWLRTAGFFLLSGWEVKDSQGNVFDSTRRELIKLVAYNVMSSDEVMQAVRWRGKDTLLRYVYGITVNETVIELVLNPFIEQHSQKLDNKERNLRKKFVIRASDAPEQPPADVGQNPDERLVTLLKEAFPLAEELFNDNTPNGDSRRAALRRGLGIGPYSQLTYMLKSMQSATNYDNRERPNTRRVGK